MPKVATKKSKTSTKTKASTKTIQESGTPGEREVIYASVKTHEKWGENAITFEEMKHFLGWETEEEYKARMHAERPDAKGKTYKFTPETVGNALLIEDLGGNKVVCWNSIRNRPFRLSHCKKLKQDILNQKWAGPTTHPNETVNGETICIGRTGILTQGNHRGIAFVFACMEWQSTPVGHPLRDLWETEPVLESLVVTGLSEHPEIVKTLDNVMPRTISDVFYTSDLFQDLTNTERKECSRMMGTCVDFLWKRLGADQISWHKYQTHSESMGFSDRHPRMLECVRTIFDLNKERSISTLRLSPGQCAGMLYLMGASNTDEIAYRGGEQLSNESTIDWEMWDSALAFWQEIAKDTELMKPVRMALGALVDSEAGGRQQEKWAIIAKAWELYSTEEEITHEALELEYYEDDEGIVTLDEFPDFEGIDMGYAPANWSPDKSHHEVPTEEDITELNKQKKKERMEAQKELLKKTQAERLQYEDQDEDE